MENQTYSQIVERVQKLYPDSKTKVSYRFVKITINAFLELVNKSEDLPDGLKKAVESDLSRQLEKARTKKGLQAGDFYLTLDTLVRSLLRMTEPTRIQSSIANQISNRDVAISRLEKEIRDIRSMVASPDIEQKLKELQTQVESIQRNTDSITSVAVEAAEDLLQRFISANKRVFVIMPFRRDLENVWLGAIKPACKECNFASLRVDEVNLSSLITEDIERFSTMANVVIVDITDNNPNVMFEFGWALAKNKKPIVICQGDETAKVPFDIRAIRYIPYENSWLGIENLRKRIREYLLTSDNQPVKKRKKKASKTSKPKTNKASSVIN